MLWSTIAVGQGVNPVYVDDSPAARDTLLRVPELVQAGNLSESVRSLQRLLDEEADRALELPGDSEIFVTVRRRVHETLLASPDLLNAYREQVGPVALAALESGENQTVERSMFLTPAGAMATLRLAQAHLESARFEAARLTLEQLRLHPERRDTAIAKPAAGLASQIARYLDRSDCWAWAEALALEAGVATPALQPISPPRSIPAPRSALTGSDRPEFGDMVWTPLRSSPLGGVATPEREDALEQIRRTAGGAPSPEPAWVIPAIAGEVVYANDGATIAALDRFTLEERWRARPVDGASRYEPLELARRPNDRNYSRGFDDANTVTLTRSLVLATTGVASSSGRTGDPRIHALDRATGRVVWSVDPADLDPSLIGASVRGPLLVDGSTVIATVRKRVPQRRLVSVYLIGLDLATGRRLWTTTIGSAGEQSTSRFGRSTEGAVISRGIVYRSDEVGVIAAVEASGGRMIWTRRAPSSTVMGPSESWPFGMVIPIIDERGLITLTPDRLDVVRLDPMTGRMLASRSAAALEQPRYLLRVGDDLVAVGERRVAFVDLATFDTAPARTSAPLDADTSTGRIAGRAFDAGGLLAVPVRAGIALIDPDAPREPVVAPLDHGGNVAIADGQVVVADHRDLHSYLVWGVASNLLRERVERAGDDPGPAITYADLASRSRRFAEVLPAIDRALEIVARQTDPTLAEPQRARLLAVVEGLVGSSVVGWDPVAPVAGGPGTTPRIDDLDLLDGLVQRMGRLASSSDEIVAHHLSLGRLRVAQGRAQDAVESYQRILGTPSLASAVWRTPGLALRAEVEATRRVRQLALDAGVRVYALFNDEARLALDRAMAGAGPDAGTLVTLARTYPASAAAPEALLRAARERLAGNRPDVGAAVSHLRDAAEAIEWASLAGVPLNPEVAPEVAGLTLRLLAEGDRAEALSAAAARFERWARVTPTDGGRTVDVQALVREAEARGAMARRPARVGAPAGDALVQALLGWSIIRPISAERDGAPELALLLASDGKTLAAHAPLETGAGLRELWRRDCLSPPLVLWQDASWICVMWHGADGGVIERLDPATGRTVWTSDTIRSIFPLDAAAQRRMIDSVGRPMTIPTPTDGGVAITDLLFASDGRTIAVAERSGRVASIDATTGTTRWASRTTLDRVYQVDTNAGVIVLGGAIERDGGPDQPAELTNAMVACDALEPGERSVATDVPGAMAWLRVGPDAVTLAGFEDGLVRADPAAGRRFWTRYRDTTDRILDAWPVGDRLMLLDATRTLWMADPASGQIAEDPLRSDDRLATRQPVLVRALADRIVFASPRGIVIYDLQGNRIGADAIGAPDTLLPPRLGADVLVTIDTNPTDTGEGRRTHTLSVLDSRTAKLIATREIAMLLPPESIGLVDGHILISAGGATLVIAAPAP
jgi:outer membrane protein assembly factor BamB